MAAGIQGGPGELAFLTLNHPISDNLLSFGLIPIDYWDEGDGSGGGGGGTKGGSVGGLMMEVDVVGEEVANDYSKR